MLALLDMCIGNVMEEALSVAVRASVSLEEELAHFAGILLLMEWIVGYIA
jgi:hypothetical protein